MGLKKINEGEQFWFQGCFIRLKFNKFKTASGTIRETVTAKILGYDTPKIIEKVKERRKGGRQDE